MKLFCYKKQIFLISVSILILEAQGSHGGGMSSSFQKIVSSVKTMSEPAMHTLTCYTDCNQKMGRQGGKAVQRFFCEQSNHETSHVMALLERSAQEPLSETEQEARKALGCLKRCRLTVIPRFFAQFFAALEEPSVTRAMAILLGANSHEQGGEQNSLIVSQGNGEKTKLFQAVFNKGIRRICRRVLRHESTLQEQFEKNSDLLRQIYFEMYGPVKMAGIYVQKYGIR